MYPENTYVTIKTFLARTRLTPPLQVKERHFNLFVRTTFICFTFDTEFLSKANSHKVDPPSRTGLVPSDVHGS